MDSMGTSQLGINKNKRGAIPACPRGSITIFHDPREIPFQILRDSAGNGGLDEEEELGLRWRERRVPELRVMRDDGAMLGQRGDSR